MSTNRLGSLLVAAAVLGLVWVLPASARPHASTTTVKVTAGKPSEYHFTLSKTSVPKGTTVFKVVDKGKLGHVFKVCATPSSGKANSCTGKATKTIEPGKSASLTIVFKKAGKYEYLCTIPGHAALGMKGLLKVTG